MRKILLFIFIFLISFIFTCEKTDAWDGELHCIYDVSGAKVTYKEGTILKDGEHKMAEDFTFDRDKVYLTIRTNKNNSDYRIEVNLTVKEFGSDYTRAYEYSTKNRAQDNSNDLLINPPYIYNKLTTCPKIGITEEGTIVLFPTTESAKGKLVSSATSITYNGNNLMGTCLAYDDPADCKSSGAVHCTIGSCDAKGPSCVWNETKYGDYCNVDKLLYIKCGDAKDIPHQVPQVVSFAVNFLKILTPIILIFISIMSLLKAISAGNEDEIKKAQKGLIRKIIAAVMVFFIISIVQFVIMKVADNETKSDVNNKLETANLSDCLNCFLNNKCENSVYYKTYVGSDLIETFLNKN